jgi:hypothetical protein
MRCPWLCCHICLSEELLLSTKLCLYHHNMTWLGCSGSYGRVPGKVVMSAASRSASCRAFLLLQSSRSHVHPCLLLSQSL